MLTQGQELEIIPKKAGTRKNYLLCKIVLFSAMTYFLVLALLFLAGTIFSGKIIQVLQHYYPQQQGFAGNFFWISFTGTLLYSAAVSGIVLFLLGRKSGFYIFIIAGVVIFSLELYYIIFDWLRYLIHTGYIFMLGIAHFSGRCYKHKQ